MPWTDAAGSTRPSAPMVRDCRGAPLVAVLAQPLDHAVDIGVRAVLAELELRFDPLDRDLDADDRAQLARDILLRRVVHRPWLGPACLVVVRESPYDVLHPGGIVVHGHRPVDMRGDVVP